ncbi:hypothetical protein ACFL27_14015 [candidate division CSSED10-310 bacterium]|uniref:Aminopeptidase n=1 Tax=candidate division CSSED10-310 bacterium TaxID=2855610 RepID=A0ABV6YZ19_UNCC1
MKLEYDLKKLYLDAFAPQAGEKVWFINDYTMYEQATEGQTHRQEMTKMWHEVMTDLAVLVGLSVEPIITIDIRDPAPGQFEADAYHNSAPLELTPIMDSWGERDIVIAITGPSITGELVRRLGKQSFRFGSAPNVRIDFEGYKADYSLIPLRFAAITDRMAKSSAAEMTFRLDHEIWKCTLDLRGQRYLFKENGAAHRPGEFINLPSGCANIQPYSGIEGDIRGDSRSEGTIPAIIDDELVLYTIRQNIIVDITGEGEQAAKEKAHILESGHPELTLITKLGLGVNDEARCNGTHVGDEKTMGMHWGYGPKKHFPDTIWAEHPIQMDLDFVYPDERREAIFRNNFYSPKLGDIFQ